MDRDELLLLAWAAATWDTATSHLDALVSVDEDTVPFSVLGRVRRERDRWAETYMVNAGLMFSDLTATVADAREFCTTHMSRLDELLNEKREN